MSDIEQRLRSADPERWTAVDRLRAYAAMSDAFVFEPDDAVELDELILEAADTIAGLEADNASLRSKLEEADGALERSDYFGSLVEKARQAAAKASVEFPQPNYVTLKIAEEAGEVVRGAVHYAEKRMEWDEVEGEIVQLLAMLIRFVTEGDQINGVIPPAPLREANHAA